MPYVTTIKYIKVLYFTTIYAYGQDMGSSDDRHEAAAASKAKGADVAEWRTAENKLVWRYGPEGQ